MTQEQGGSIHPPGVHLRGAAAAGAGGAATGPLLKQPIPAANPVLPPPQPQLQPSQPPQHVQPVQPFLLCTVKELNMMP
jgi:hypothetical protein